MAILFIDIGNLVVKNGNILFILTSSGQEWQFYSLILTSSRQEWQYPIHTDI